MAPQEQARHQVEVMLHFANGGEVECANRILLNWRPDCAPQWDWHTCLYRIVKPEPKKVKMWQALFVEFGKFCVSYYFYESDESAKQRIGNSFIRLLPHTEIEVEVTE
jgi:hypothetical protein